MTDWITDRLPTEEDADEAKDVKIPPGDPNDSTGYYFYHYTLIVPGQPWYPCRFIAPADQPEPNPPEPCSTSELPPTSTFYTGTPITIEAEPTNQDLFEQAQIDHLRAKTELIRAQVAAITWATTFFNNNKDLAPRSGMPEFITSIINKHPGEAE
jgi:hypothetical protein